MMKKFVYGAQFASETSFPLDGGRLGWGCEQKYKAPPPLSSPVEGEESDRENGSVLRLEGIIEKITMVIDDTVVCDSGKILV
jgi:hypothetical protein